METMETPTAALATCYKLLLGLKLNTAEDAMTRDALVGRYVPVLLEAKYSHRY